MVAKRFWHKLKTSNGKQPKYAQNQKQCLSFLEICGYEYCSCIKPCIKPLAFEIGVINVEAETELDSARQQIQKLLREHPHLPYEPSEDWKFLDCAFPF